MLQRLLPGEDEVRGLLALMLLTTPGDTVLYDLLEQIAREPVFTLNRAVAVGMFRGPAAGLDVLAEVERDDRLAGRHRVAAVRGHLLELAGDTAEAAAAYETASLA